jgi:hypothetical protein
MENFLRVSAHRDSLIMQDCRMINEPMIIQVDKVDDLPTISGGDCYNLLPSISAE